MSENYEKIKKFQDEFFSTWSKEEQADMAHKFMGENLDNLVEQAERVQELKTYVETGTYIQRKLRKENRRCREAIKFANDELNEVLHANKTLDVKKFYIENAKRKLTEALEGESDE